MADDESGSRAERWRLRIGAGVLIAGFLAPAAIPLVASTGLPTAWKAAISGALAIGVPEIMMLAAVAIMGRPGFARLRQALSRFVREHGPQEHVGPTRHRIGLVLFLLPLLSGWLMVYVRHVHPEFDPPLYVHAAGDLMFLSSFFVLGGGFWDKTRALFLREARAVLPEHRD